LGTKGENSALQARLVFRATPLSVRRAYSRRKGHQVANPTSNQGRREVHIAPATGAEERRCRGRCRGNRRGQRRPAATSPGRSRQDGARSGGQRSMGPTGGKNSVTNKRRKRKVNSNNITARPVKRIGGEKQKKKKKTNQRKPHKKNYNHKKKKKKRKHHANTQKRENAKQEVIRYLERYKNHGVAT